MNIDVNVLVQHYVTELSNLQQRALLAETRAEQLEAELTQLKDGDTDGSN